MTEAQKKADHISALKYLVKLRKKTGLVTQDHILANLKDNRFLSAKIEYPTKETLMAAKRPTSLEGREADYQASEVFVDFIQMVATTPMVDRIVKNEVVTYDLNKAKVESLLNCREEAYSDSDSSPTDREPTGTIKKLYKKKIWSMHTTNRSIGRSSTANIPFGRRGPHQLLCCITLDPASRVFTQGLKDRLLCLHQVDDKYRSGIPPQQGVTSTHKAGDVGFLC